MSSGQGIETIDLTGSPEPPTRVQTTRRQSPLQPPTQPMYKTERTETRADRRMRQVHAIDAYFRSANDGQSHDPQTILRALHESMTYAGFCAYFEKRNIYIDRKELRKAIERVGSIKEALDIVGDINEAREEERETPARSHSRPHHRQHRIPHYFRERPSSLASNLKQHAPSPPINPDQLRRIINSSPPENVNAVLLDLCKISPALSGAVVRGLAPHSTYAQTIKKHYPQSSMAYRQAPAQVHKHIKTEGRRTSQLQERAGPSGYKSARRRSAPLKHEDGSDDDLPNISRFKSLMSGNGQSPPPVSDSDQQRLATDAHNSFRPNQQQTLRGYAYPQSESSNTIPNDVITASSTVAFFGDDSDLDDFAPRSTKTCKLCFKQISAKDHTVCHFHPRVHDANLGLPYYGCCGKPIGVAGCRSSVHDV
ncbi:unnamed protein product [Periconia digitata]|uniref:Uncharacterized protein n=1 Tax=Periconia digitata TaxID=1303443 RepID=A0A9W4XR68_9PLEO|nr:unnamed protein product [Periconia digitata]